LEAITLKLTTLLALATGQRVQTLSKIDIRNIQKTKDQIEIFIPDLIKTSGPNKPQPCLLLPRFEDKPSLCLLSNLEEYLLRTADLRPADCYALLLTFKRPFRPATSQTISRWIKTILAKAGVDTNVFKAHSTRHASASHANRAGVDIDVIRKTVGWSNNSCTFARFYNRPMESRSNFAKSLIE
jgi:integrase